MRSLQIATANRKEAVCIERRYDDMDDSMAGGCRLCCKCNIHAPW